MLLVLPTPESRIFVAGHSGLVGSAICRNLAEHGYQNILTATRAELDLTDQAAVLSWFQDSRPEYVYLVAGKVGGIVANSASPASFLYENLMIHTSVIEAARRSKVTKLLYLGSSCIYPRHATQPITEDQLLQGPLEPTNEGYALAKITGIKMCDYYRAQHGCDFISAMPTNLYGPNDNFDLETSHVVPALIRKFHEARESGESHVEIWGSGNPMREFLHVDDLADACRHLMDNYSGVGHINVGTGTDVTIRELAETLRSLIHPASELTFDASRPDGTPRKVLNVDRLNATGWTASTTLEEGLASTYDWFLQNLSSFRGTATT